MFSIDENRKHQTDRPEGEGRCHGYHRHHHSEGNGHHRHHGDGEGRRHGRHGGRGEKKGLSAMLEGKPDAMLLFVGALNCTRHRADQLGELMRAGRLALLCPTATDYATGRYLHQIVDAMVELSKERNIKEFVVMYGCQCAVLSTDFEMIAQELKDDHGITATLDATCHLCGNAQGDEDDHRNQERM